MMERPANTTEIAEPMSYTPKTMLLIESPESYRIKDHPEALSVGDDESYIVPPEVWEKYKNTYYSKGAEQLEADARRVAMGVAIEAAERCEEAAVIKVQASARRMLAPRARYLEAVEQAGWEADVQRALPPEAVWGAEEWGRARAVWREHWRQREEEWCKEQGIIVKEWRAAGRPDVVAKRLQAALDDVRAKLAVVERAAAREAATAKEEIAEERVAPGVAAAARAAIARNAASAPKKTPAQRIAARRTTEEEEQQQRVDLAATRAEAIAAVRAARDVCGECGLSDHLIWHSNTNHRSYCNKCNKIVCERCRAMAGEGKGGIGIFCLGCVYDD